MIVFKKIIAKDCFAFEYLEFDFISGIHSIVGVNGASKTSLLLALSQGLFNKNPKNTRIDDVSNYITGQPYEIKIFFDKDGDQFEITNSRKSGSINAKVNGKDISLKTIPQNLELIKRIIGDEYSTFINVTYQASDSALDLLEESSDAARKNFINKILKFDELDEKLANCKEKLKRLKLIHKDKQDQLSQWQGNLLPMREVVEKVDTAKLIEEVALRLKARDSADWYRNDRSIAKVEEAAKRKAYNEYKNAVAQIDIVRAKLSAIEVPSRSSEVVEKELAKSNEELSRVRSSYNEAENKLSKLQEPELTCSRCGQSVAAEQALTMYQEDVAKFTLQLNEAKQEKNRLLNTLNELSEQKRVWSAISELSSREEILKSALVVVEEADEASYNKACADHDYAVQNYQEAVEAHTKATNELNAAIRHNDTAAMMEKLNNEAAESNKQATVRINKLTEELQEVEKRMDLLDNWTRILGPNGYRVHSMSRFLKVLNQTMDKYADIISGGRIKCTFYVTEEGKVDFSVVDPDKKVPFANWSKGEQARVKLACLFSVIELLEVMGSASYNVLVLDEIFSALDDEGKEGLFEVLSYLRSNGKCIYTISHTPLVNPVVFDSAIQVVKENGLARII